MHNKVEIIELVFECAFVAPHSLALFLRTFMSKCQNLYISEIVCLDWTTLKPRAFFFSLLSDSLTNCWRIWQSQLHYCSALTLFHHRRTPLPNNSTICDVSLYLVHSWLREEPPLWFTVEMCNRPSQPPPSSIAAYWFWILSSTDAVTDAHRTSLSDFGCYESFAAFQKSSFEHFLHCLGDLDPNSFDLLSLQNFC